MTTWSRRSGVGLATVVAVLVAVSHAGLSHGDAIPVGGSLGHLLALGSPFALLVFGAGPTGTDDPDSGDRPDGGSSATVAGDEMSRSDPRAGQQSGTDGPSSGGASGAQQPESGTASPEPPDGASGATDGSDGHGVVTAGRVDSATRDWRDRLPGVGRLLQWSFVAVVVTTLAAGTAFLLVPGAFAGTPVLQQVRTVVESLGVPPWMLGQALGAATLTLAVVALSAVRRTRATETVDTAVAGRVTGDDATEAGRDLDATVTEIRDVAGTGRARTEAASLRARLREELREAAVTVLALSEDRSRDEADRLLASGEWTDDPRAAAVFREGSPPWPVRLRDWVSRTPTSVLRAEAVAGELEGLLVANGVTVPDGSDEDGPAPASGPTTTAWQTVHDVDGGVASSDTARFDPTAVPAAGDAARVAGQENGDAGVIEGVTGERDGEPSGLDAASVDGDGDAAPPGDDVATGAVESLETSSGRRRNRGNAVGLVALATGIGTATPFAALLGTVGVVYGAFDHVTGEPRSAVEVTREIGATRPSPGDVLWVRVRVTNVGDAVLPDVRVVDGVPTSLPVVEGSPGIHTALRPGESDSVTYAVRARRGTFDFGETDVVLRNLGGTQAVGGAVTVATPIRCTSALEDVPVHDQTRPEPGQIQTDSGGEGIEFYATRDYRTGDPPGRINWSRLAKTKELTTVQYRERHSATVLLLVDARDAAAVASGPSQLDGIELATYAAERTARALLGRHVAVGVLVYDGSRLSHVPSGSGETQASRLATALEAVSSGVDAGEASAVTETGADEAVRAVRERLPSRSQVVVFSPALDEFPLAASRAFQAAGHGTTVFSPAVVGDGTLGHRTRGLERACLLQAVRETGAYVVDWDTDEHVAKAVRRVTRRVGT